MGSLEGHCQQRRRGGAEGGLPERERDERRPMGASQQCVRSRNPNIPQSQKQMGPRTSGTANLRTLTPMLQTYGNALNYSMRAPPKGRRCGYMSWMSDLPDEFLLSMHEYNIETAKHDLGRSKKKPPLPHQIRTQVKQPAQS